MTRNPYQHYQGEAGANYFKYQNQGGFSRGKLNARVKFSKHVQPTDTVLDFGCGSGALLKCLDCSRRIGVEINPIARDEASANGVEVYEKLDDIEDNISDIAISNHALEHVPNPLNTLQKLRNKLHVDGKLVLVVPLDDWRTQKHVNARDINRHLYTWTPLLLGNLLDEAGYKVSTIQISTHAWMPYWEIIDEAVPPILFDFLCKLYGWTIKRRQLIAVAYTTIGHQI